MADSPDIQLDFRDRCCVPRLLTASLEEVPPGATLTVRIDIHPIVDVRRVLEEAGWEIMEKVFLPAERGFRLTARKRV